MSTLQFDNNDRLDGNDEMEQLLIEYLKCASANALDETKDKMFHAMSSASSGPDSGWWLAISSAILAHAIPPEHPAAQALVNLIKAAHEDPRWPEGTKDRYDSMSMALRDELNDELSYLDIKFDASGQRVSPIGDIELDLRYRNFQAFAIRMQRVMTLRTAYVDVWCLWAMGDAFEGRSKQSGQRDAWVLSAAEWVFGYGTSLYDGVLNNTKWVDRYTGDLWDARLRSLRRRWAVRTVSQTAKARWNFWKDGFRAVAVGKRDREYQFAAVTKEAAAKAVARMEEIERDAETDSEARSVTTIDECDDKGKGEEQDPRGLRGKFCGVFGR